MLKTIASVFVFLLLNGDSNSGNGSQFTKAQFTFSSDPTKVVLFVNVASSDMRSRSVILHGDGHIVLQIQTGSGKVLERYERELEYEELQLVLRKAVNHGLAEWDTASVHARQLQKRGGRPYAPPSDGPDVTVLLALESYTRGDYSQENLERTIRLRSPGFSAKVFPEIQELQGVSDLAAWLYEELERAQKEAAP